jgi:hypothetical protein
MSNLEYNLEYLLKRMSRSIQEDNNYEIIEDYVAIYLLRLQIKSKNVEY